MKRFRLNRLQDETKISGTGHVADGVQFRNGKCVLCWNTDYSSVAVYDDVVTLMKIHGHDGKTVLEWIDEFLENKGDISDGYHTFDELYEHRHILFINLLQHYRESAFKTWLNDKKERWEGWFICGLNTTYGQITYHLPSRFWDAINVKEVDYNSDYDGHSASDVLGRLTKLIK
jgi:hypothetical protein